MPRTTLHWCEALSIAVDHQGVHVVALFVRVKGFGDVF
jgi:hypothetical protein